MILVPLVEYRGQPRDHKGRFAGNGAGNLPPDIANYTKAQLAGLSDYQISGPSINSELRAGGPWDTGWGNSVRLIDEAFMRTPPTTQDAVVYRGMPASWGLHRGEPGYVSTSTDRVVAQDFVGYARDAHQYDFQVFEIHVPKGTRVIMLDQLGQQYQAAFGTPGSRLVPGLFDVHSSEWTLPRGGSYTAMPDGSIEYRQPAEYDA